MARSTLPPSDQPAPGERVDMIPLLRQTNEALRDGRGSLRKACEELEAAREASRFKYRPVRK